MRLYITSDTHNSTNLVDFVDNNSFDAIFHCGDITNHGLKTFIPADYKTINYFNQIQTPLYYVPGNHDCGFGHQDIINGNSTNVLGKLVQFMDYSIYGFSLSPCYNRPELYTTWDNMVVDIEVEMNYYRKAPYADIIISHCPPKNCNLDITSEGVSIGSLGLYNYILEKQPKYVFCGHVHSNKIRTKKINNTIVYNVATNYLKLTL